MMTRPVKKTSSNIEDRIKDLTELESPEILTFYGRPGTGKTSLASTAPKPLLIIDVKDKGTDSAKSEELEEGEIEVISIENFSEIWEVFDLIQNQPKRWKTVVIDHMTSLQDFCQIEVMKNENKTMMSQRLYGDVSGKMKEVIHQYKNLTDLNITPIFLVQERVDTEGEGEDQLAPEVGPSLSPAIAKTLSASSRVIGHTYLQEKENKTKSLRVEREVEYRLRLGPDPYYTTKVTRPRGTQCPDYIVNPTYDKIIEIMRGEYKPPRTSTRRKRKRTSRV